MLSKESTRVLTVFMSSYWNPMQWIQEKFAPAPKKASERAVKHQDAAPAQDEVFHAAPTSDTKVEEATSKKKKESQVPRRPKQPAHEVRLTVHTCSAPAKSPTIAQIFHGQLQDFT